MKPKTRKTVAKIIFGSIYGCIGLAGCYGTLCAFIYVARQLYDAYMYCPGVLLVICTAAIVVIFMFVGIMIVQNWSMGLSWRGKV